MPTNLSIIPAPAVATVNQRGHHRAPTPWITATLPTDTTTTAYKFRLIMRRRGGAVHVEFHPQSGAAPGKTYAVRSTRLGYEPFVLAATQLMRLAMWAPDQPAGKPRATWNLNARDAGLRVDLAQTVASYLPRLITPRRGRPAFVRYGPTAEPAIDNTPQVRVAYAAARRARIREALAICQRVTNLLIPLQERMGLGNRMAGFTKEELRFFVAMVAELEYANNTLRNAAMTGAFIPAAAPAPGPDIFAPQPASRYSRPTEPFELPEFVDVPASTAGAPVTAPVQVVSTYPTGPSLTLAEARARAKPAEEYDEETRAQLRQVGVLD